MKTNDFLAFLNATPTPFHVVKEVKRRLDLEGFEELKENRKWAFRSGHGYYVTRGGTSIVAFVVGSQPVVYNGFKIIGAHTDSPTLKLKPNYAYNQSGYLQFGVEPYGGGVWRPWIDRDLYVTGRIVVRAPDGRLSSHLIEVKDLIVSIPGLAIHLDRAVNENGAINVQSNLPATIALEGVYNIEKLNKLLLASCSVIEGSEIVSTNLSLSSIEDAVVAGLNKEFVRSGRLDNLASCHEAVTALINAKDPTTTCVVSLWDHEEVGSASYQGAAGTFLKDVLERIVEALPLGEEQGAFKRAISNSFCISADLAHAVHPNHPEKHEAHHAPKIGGGPVIKINASQRYATSDVTAAVFSDLCIATGVKYQTFVTRSDLPCGSTIGSITANSLGIKTVDVGIPMLAMHSIREQCGTEDHFAMEKVFEAFFARGREEVFEF